ncbi:MAG: S8 family serine peptidase, partial [Nocardioidaceae bacterium]
CTVKLSVGGSGSSRKSFVVAVAVAALATVGLGTTTAQAAGQKLAKQSAHNVIVVLRSQHPNLKIKRGTTNSPRVRAFRSDQSPVLSQARKAGATHLRGFTTVNAIAARVTPTQAVTLASDPAVAAIYPDLQVKAAPLVSSPSVASATSGATGSPTVESEGICPSDPSKPLLEPEALQITNTAFSNTSTPQAQNLVDGSGVKVAFIADGVDINNADFIRADGTHVFVDYQDFSGDGLDAVTGGAEAFGDASAIAAQGRQAYDLANFVHPAHPLPPGCDIEIRGMAPGASLIGLKVFGNENSAPTSRFIEAIDYAVTDGADVLNESFGGNPFPDTGNDPISLADKAAVAAGVTVVASSGDAGVNGTVGSPASADSGIISVGATTAFRSYIQSAYAGAQLSNGTWVDNNISGLSSAGINERGRTVDLVAPGDLDWALCTPDLSKYTECTSDAGAPSPIQDFGGTSQSSPLTAGAAALVIEAYKNTHNGVRPSPSVVQRILTSTATDLGHPAAEQGAGELNSLKAVQAAESWRDGNGHPAPTGSALVVNKTQLTPTGSPGQHVSQRLSVTNVSGTSQKVTASTRTLGKTVDTISGTATLDTATAPVYVDSFAIPRSYVKVNFDVPAGVDRVTMTAAINNSAIASRIILIDPNGVYTAYSIPQGAGNYAEVDARYPTAGTWTAYLAVSQSTGFNGTLPWQVLEQDFTTHGSVSPSSFTLRAGATRTVVVHSTEPNRPRDLSALVQLRGSVSGVTSVPLTLRAAVPGRNYSFDGTIFGGNGRSSGGVAQSNVYYLDVPPGRRDLGVGIQYGDPGNVVLATLSAPNGEVYSWTSNVASGSASQSYVRAPMPGRWVLSLEVLNPVSGLFTSSPFQVSVAYDTVHASAVGLPTSARTTLAAGVPVTVPVTITDNSAAPLSYFVDGRLNQTGPIQLININSPDTFPLPQPDNVLPAWLVPSHVTSLTATATADQPVNMDLFFDDGNPDLYSAASGNGATVTDSAPQVSPGFWLADLGQTGPFSGPAPAGTVTVGASAIGQLFDPAISTSGGDYWQGAASSSSSLSAVLDRLMAARSGASSMHPSSSRAPLALPSATTIDVTITPTAASGTTVHGHLYLDSFDPGTGDADELVELPYTYTVK